MAFSFSSKSFLENTISEIFLRSMVLSFSYIFSKKRKHRLITDLPRLHQNMAPCLPVLHMHTSPSQKIKNRAFSGTHAPGNPDHFHILLGLIPVFSLMHIHFKLHGQTGRSFHLFLQNPGNWKFHPYESPPAARHAPAAQAWISALFFQPLPDTIHGYFDDICCSTLDRRVHGYTFSEGTLHEIAGF